MCGRTGWYMKRAVQNQVASPPPCSGTPTIHLVCPFLVADMQVRACARGSWCVVRGVWCSYACVVQQQTQRFLQAEREASGLPPALASVRALAAELPEWSMVDTISHLQHQLALASRLGDAAGFKAWLRVYVRCARVCILAPHRVQCAARDL